MTLQYEQELYTLTSDFYNQYPRSSFQKFYLLAEIELITVL